MKFLELFFKSGEVTGLGLIAVFAIIATIFFVIKGLGKAASPEKPAPVAANKEEAPAAAEVITEAAPAEVPEASDDLELIAVLAAAISAYSGEPISKFRVVSFKHIK